MKINIKNEDYIKTEDDLKNVDELKKTVHGTGLHNLSCVCLCMVHRNQYLCRVFCVPFTPQTIFALFGKMLNLLKLRTKIQTHFKGSKCEIVFLKLDFLLA